MNDAIIRLASPDDVGALLQLVRDLAAYEKEPGAVIATEADFRRHGFGPDKKFEALLAFVDGKPAGFALFFMNFSTWLGKPGLYLEDLFVHEWARKARLGRRLVGRLASIARERDCGRLDFAVLHWNPAREFYHRLGFEHQKDWLPYRASRDVIDRLADEDAAEGRA